MKNKPYPGVNVQWPISELILTKVKTIETRTYPLPEKYLNVELVLIETPGPDGDFKARAVAIIKFTNSFKYKDSKEFYKDFDKHRVNQNSLWAWKEDKPKWGWEVKFIKKINSKPVPSKGIVFTKKVFI